MKLPDKARARRILDTLQIAQAITRGHGFRQPPTGKHALGRQPLRPTLMETAAAVLYGEPFKRFERSKRGQAREELRLRANARVTEAKPAKYWNQHSSLAFIKVEE